MYKNTIPMFSSGFLIITLGYFSPVPEVTIKAVSTETLYKITGHIKFLKDQRLGICLFLKYLKLSLSVSIRKGIPLGLY